MILIEIENVKSRIVGNLNKDIHALLTGKLSYELPGAFFASRYNPFAGRRFLYSKPYQNFPTGLIHLVEEILKDHQIQYSIVDKRVPINIGPELPYFGPPLRDYQDEAVNNAVEKQRGIIKVATGGGKTLIIARIISKLNVPTLILTHKTDLLYQLKREIELALQVPVGIIGDGQCDIQKFTVATIQTISRAYDEPKKKKKKKDPDDLIILTKADKLKYLVQNVSCMITDEVHHVAADAFWNVHKNAINSLYKVGLSASPWRIDNADLLIEAAHARRLVDISASLLIDRGYLTQPIVYLYKYKHEKKQRDDTYPVIYDDEVVNNLERNKVIVQSALKASAQGKTVLIAVTKIEHGKILEAMLQQVEPEALFCYGESDSEERQRVLSELDKGTRKIVITTSIFGEGINVPNLKVLINAKAAASSVDAFQLIGRVLRKTPTKTKAYVVDIFDQGCKYLGQHANERLRIYQTEPNYQLNVITTVNDIIF